MPAVVAAKAGNGGSFTGHIHTHSAFLQAGMIWEIQAGDVILNIFALVYTQTTTGAILAPEGGLTQLRLIQHSIAPNYWHYRNIFS